jgi:Na+:H+ antiporter, NhaA family
VLGIWCGLLIGKPLGITLASWIVVRLGWAALPSQVRWRDLHAASWLAGIGFTMSLFIAGLAFSHQDSLSLAKLGVFGGSLMAGSAGSILFLTNKAPSQAVERDAEPLEFVKD